MGRGRSTSGGGGRGMSSSGRGMSSSGGRGFHHGSTTVIIGGGHGHYHHGHGGRPSKAGNIIASIIFLMFGIIFFSALIGSIINVNSYNSVQGIVVKNEQVNGWYYTTYEYTVDGVEYVNRSNEGWEFPEENETATIYYEKDNPNNIIETKPELGFGTVIIGIIAVAFTAAGVILLVQGIKMKREDEVSETSSTSSSTSSNPTSEQYNRCAYCGTKYKSDLSSCPKCGAGK